MAKGFLKYAFGSTALGGAGYALAQAGLGPLTFSSNLAPEILATTGAVLPPLWWVLSNLPPKPKVEFWPGMRLLFESSAGQPKPKIMPPWHKALCLAAVVSASLGATSPEFNDLSINAGGGPIVIAIDNGWSSAPIWDQMIAKATKLLDAAEREGMQVVLMPSAHVYGSEDGDKPIAMSIEQARSALVALEPQAWATNHAHQREALRRINTSEASIFWISDGISTGDEESFLVELKSHGNVTLYETEAERALYLLSLADYAGQSLDMTVRRLHFSEQSEIALIASDESGQPLLRQIGNFDSGDEHITVSFTIPGELRQEIESVRIEGQKTSGATVLLDEKWQRRTVGVVDTGISEALQDGTFFVRKAIEPFADIQRGTLQHILSTNPAVVVLTDDITILDKDRGDLQGWVENGGVLLRFAGPNLAARPDDTLLPVHIRKGSKATEGALSGANNAKIAKFAQNSAFGGIDIPENVEVDQIVVAEPAPDVPGKTWAELQGGVPFVTAENRGEGWIILVHTSANAQWSNLPLSGKFFLEMMRAVVSFGRTSAQEVNLVQSLTPHATISVSGDLDRPSATVRPLTQDNLENCAREAAHPPGFYGSDDLRVACNISDVTETLAALNIENTDVQHAKLGNATSEYDVGAFFWVGAIALAMADIGIRLGQSGPVPGANSAQNSVRRRDPKMEPA